MYASDLLSYNCFTNELHSKTEVNTSITIYKEWGDTMSELYTCAQIADRYHVKTITVWSWIRKHKLHAKKIGKQYLISDEDIKDFEKEAT